MSCCIDLRRVCSSRSSIRLGRDSICKVASPSRRCWDLKSHRKKSKAREKSMAGASFPFFGSRMSCAMRFRVHGVETNSYRDTEKSVRQHIALDKPVRGRLAACMDIVVRPFDTRSNTAVFEYASVRCELFYAI